MKRIFIALCFMPITAWADVTGAGDAAIVQQLVTLVKSANYQLEEMRKTTSITERLENMEQAKAVRRLAEEGKAMGDLIKEGEKLESNLMGLKGDPSGTGNTKWEIERIQRDLKNAKDADSLGQAKAYSRMLADLKRLEFLGKAQKESMKTVSKGANETDNTKVTATSTMIMSDLMLQKEKEAQAKKSQEVKALGGALESLQYSSIVVDEKGRK